MTSNFEDLDAIVQRLAVLNQQFSESISMGNGFEKTRKIFLEIKETHRNLRSFFNKSRGTTSDGRADHESPIENPLDFLIQKWDSKELPDTMKDYVAGKIPVMRLVYPAV